MREFRNIALTACQGNRNAKENFLFSFFLAKKFEKDYDNFFRIAANIFNRITGTRFEDFF